MSLSFNLNFDTGTQEITNLGNVPAYTRSGLGAVDIFRVEAGKPYGTMYGYQYATSLDDLTVTDGLVMNNAASNALNGGQYGTDAYSINEHGYVVHTADIGTSSLSQGPSAHSTLVEVKKFMKELPPINILDKPNIVNK